MLRIFVFFVFVCAWCAEPFCTEESPVRGVKECTFSVPSRWKREVFLSEPVEPQIFAADSMPQGLTDLTVMYAADNDRVLITNERYCVSCDIFWTASFSSGSLLDLRCTASGPTYQGTVMMCPFFESMGGMVLVKPMAEGGRIVTFNRAGTLVEDGPRCFCDYAVNDRSFTIDRLVQLYEGESYYFVGVTFNYSQLNRVLIEWGVKKGASRKVVDFDWFEFPPSIGGLPVVRKPNPLKVSR